VIGSAARWVWGWPGIERSTKESAVLMLWARRWLLLAVGVPVLAWILERVGQGMEERDGPTDLSRGLQGAAGRIRDFRGRRRGRRGLLG
jgi:hypothetical protein